MTYRRSLNKCPHTKIIKAVTQEAENQRKSKGLDICSERRRRERKTGRGRGRQRGERPETESEKERGRERERLCYYNIKGANSEP